METSRSPQKQDGSGEIAGAICTSFQAEPAETTPFRALRTDLIIRRNSSFWYARCKRESRSTLQRFRGQAAALPYPLAQILRGT
jgi:hypothetical protein